MRRLLIAALFLSVLNISFAQDTTKKSSYRHEIGFNAMRLLDLISIIDAPADQLPYDIFYNFYFNDQLGLRLGAGLLKQDIQTQIPGQSQPRKTNLMDLDVRFGLTNNFARVGGVTFNAFADVVWQNQENKTVTTTTMQVFGNPVLTTTVKNEETSTGLGGQVGLGINCRIYKNICLYTEVPLTFVNTETSTRDEVSDDMGNFDMDSNSFSSSEFRITLPATIYLVLRF